MTNRKAINIVAAAIIAAAGLGLYAVQHPSPPQLGLRPHTALGEVLGAEAVKRLEPGARVVVFARDPKAFEVPGCAAQLEAFLAAVKKSGQTVAGIRAIQLDPLRPSAVPSADFFDQMRLGRPNDVIVSFLGPPILDSQQLVKLGSKRPHVLAVCSGNVPAQMNLKVLFDQRLLAAAVISRMDLPAGSGAASKQAAFEQMFKLITPANLEELPPQRPAGR